jgi:hypothetical protein
METYGGRQYILLYQLSEEFCTVFLFGCNNNGVRSIKDNAVGRNENGRYLYQENVILQATFTLTKQSHITRHYMSWQKIRPYEQFSSTTNLC